MSGARRTEVIPDVAITAAARLVAYGEDLQATWERISAEIRACEAAEHWGHNDYGRDFTAKYYGELGAEDARDAVDGCTNRIIDSGYGMGTGAVRTEMEDEANSRMIGGST